MHKILLAAALLCSCLSAQAAERYSFGVLSQRSPVLTAQYWNPILAYVSRKTGIDLELKVARTAPESSAAIGRGEYDFAYSNHLFMPANQAQKYEVILRPRSEAITGQIVTQTDSSVLSIADLDGNEVGFPSPSAFVGYAVPMDHLTRQGIHVRPVFGGNQEGIMAQLRAGKVKAAAVNNLVMQDYAARVGMQYRVLWQSEPYNNIPIAVHPRVPKPVAGAVQQALAGMYADPIGNRVLERSAALLEQAPPLGFMTASPADYRNYLEFYRHTVLKDLE